MDDDFDASADFRYAMILTWNPDEFDWGDDFRKTVEESADNDEIELSWSTGNRNSGVSDGDRVFLLRQGTQGRGIVASGYTRGQIETDRNWRKDQRARQISSWSLWIGSYQSRTRFRRMSSTRRFRRGTGTAVRRAERSSEERSSADSRPCGGGTSVNSPSVNSPAVQI